MGSPWANLPSEPPIVLPEDRPWVETFNELSRDRPSWRIRTELLPEPFIGRVDAPLVILALNPGFSEEDLGTHTRPEFMSEVRRCISAEPGPYPFFHLNPALNGPGWDWWKRALKELLDRKYDRKVLAQSILCLEFFPYRSEEFAHGHLRLPSQEYTFSLLRAAIARAAPIIVTRGFSYWTGAVPALASYPRMFRTRSQRTARISERNCPLGFASACRVIEDASAQSRLPPASG